MIIAIIFYPLYEKLGRYFGKRKKMASLLITITALAILLVPSYWLLASLVDGLAHLGTDLKDGIFEIPPPSEQVLEWPIIGNWLYTNWMAASENLGDAIKEYLPQITAISEKLLGALAGTGLGILQFALSTIIAGVLLTHSGDAAKSGKKFFTRLAGDRGEEFAKGCLAGPHRDSDLLDDSTPSQTDTKSSRTKQGPRQHRATTTPLEP